MCVVVPRMTTQHLETVMRQVFPIACSASLTLILLLSGCAGESTESESGYGMETDSGFVRDPTMVEGEERVEVTLDDFVIEMPDSVPSNFVVFEATNRGTNEHSLEVEGGGVHVALPDAVDPGNTMELTAQLQPGTYRVYCPVEDHAQRGMEKTITVY